MFGSRLGERRPLLTLGLTTGVVALGFAGFVAVGSGDTTASAHTTTAVASPLDKSGKGGECSDDDSSKGDDKNKNDDDCTVTVTRTKTKTVTVGKGVTTTVSVPVTVTVTVTTISTSTVIETITSTTTITTGPLTTP
ncbi:MAG TPA: hypothetical protein VH134_08360 [Candidatus Dormibacteraeota bacterium]|nr:hypothetical protein [Candidatus Dormibacteraeota bacterium]